MIDAFGKSHIGLKRESNQDSFYYGQNDHQEFIAFVADGIGGGKAGDVASNLAKTKLTEAFMTKAASQNENELKHWIEDAIAKCNHTILEEAERNQAKQGMGTTLVGVFILKQNAYLFHMGDSRLYGFYDEIVCLTEDHNLAADLIRSGETSEAEALSHPKGKALTNALGIWNAYRIDIARVKPGWHYLMLCSDGLHGYVPEDIIASIVMDEKQSLEAKCDALIRQANLTGGYDNITIILMQGWGK